MHDRTLTALDVGKVENSPFDSSEQEGLALGRQEGNREDVPTGSRFLGLLLRAAEDPEVGLGQFAQGVRVGPGTRMPRLLAVYRPKGKWRLASQTDPRTYLEEEDHREETAWRRNYATFLPDPELGYHLFSTGTFQVRQGPGRRSSPTPTCIGGPTPTQPFPGTPSSADDNRRWEAPACGTRGGRALQTSALTVSDRPCRRLVGTTHETFK